MLRDGQYLAEPPVKIGAHYVRHRRHEMTDTELFTQAVLLGDRIKRKRDINWPAIMVVGYVAAVSALGIIKNI